jgi:hypothetical protein
MTKITLLLMLIMALGLSGENLALLNHAAAAAESPSEPPELRSSSETSSDEHEVKVAGDRYRNPEIRPYAASATDEAEMKR